MSRQSPTEDPPISFGSAGYASRGSGILRGGGGTGFRRKRRRGQTRNIPNLSLYDRDGIRKLPPFDEGLQYTNWELLLYAERYLIEDSKPVRKHPQILLMTHLKDRQRHEIYASNGTPDPSIVKGIYNRTHPNGRRVNSDEQRRLNGASFYR